MIWMVGIFLVGVGIWAPLLHRDMKRAVVRIAESARRTEQAEALRAAYLRAGRAAGEPGRADRRGGCLGRGRSDEAPQGVRPPRRRRPVGPLT